ncbi:titin homolog isoform X2 [Watersipora subatra]|uniref:titin homolog isoform X2 n=1 Tax=Watersipora subatra TaxID=2589382 RepID=UPI00355B1EF8
MTDTRRQVSDNSISQISEAPDGKSRMSLFEQREKDFIEFVKETPRNQQVEEDTDDRPLSGLQCLLALTEILEKAAQLRLTNYDLEQRIETLQRLKQIAEVQSELRNAKLDINANGIARGKKGKAADETDGRRLKRTLSAESLHTPISKFDSSADDFHKHRATLGKGSKFSETWEKVKDRLAPKDSAHIQTPLSSKPPRRRQSSNDSALTLKHSVSADSHTSQTSQACVQFTQREINISPPNTDDFGGVWLGDSGNSGNDGSEFGGVYLGPPSPSQAPTEVSLIIEINKNGSKKMAAKEELGSQSSDPMTERSQPLVKVDPSWTRVRCTSNDESQDWLSKTLHKDNQPSPLLRKKSSKTKLLAILPGTEQKSTKKVSPSDDLPKEFRKKIEEWHMIKEYTASGTAEGQLTAKAAKAGKTKNQRFKNKKKGSLLKQRSKSAERVEDSSYGRQHSDDFEEKLRVWSVKQGYHPTYYSEIRTSIGSSDSVSEVSSRESRDRLGSKVESMGIAEGVSDQSLSPNTHASSCTDSSNSLSPSAAVYFLSAENLHTLYEISQSADVIFHRESPATAKISQFLSKSEETINRSAAHTTMLTTETKHTNSVSNSHVDVYAKASDCSLERHLSLYHVASDTSINTDTAIEQSAASRSSHSSIDCVSEGFLDIPSTISACTSSNTSLQLEPLSEIPSSKSEAMLTDGSAVSRDLHGEGRQDTNSELVYPTPKTLSDEAHKEYLDDSLFTVNNSRRQSKLSLTANDGTTCKGKAFTGKTENPSNTDNKIEFKDNDAANEEATRNDNMSNEKASGDAEIANKEAASHQDIANEDIASDRNADSSDRLTGSEQTRCSPHQLKAMEEKEHILQDSTPAFLSDADTNCSESHVKTQNAKHDNYDINSNVTNNQHNSAAAELNDTLGDSLVLHLGTDVPLKTRLKSLALEYQAEELKRKTCNAPTSNKLSSNFPESGSNGKPKSKVQQEKGALTNNRYNCMTQPLHPNLHRLKSADQLIYDQTSQATKPYSRQATKGNLNLSTLGTRREMHEKPKEGTVKKALSMFIDNGTFNGQFGTDFAKAAPRPQPS